MGRGVVRIDPETAIYGTAGNPLDYPSALRRAAYYVDGVNAVRLGWDWTEPAAIRLTADGSELTDLGPRARLAVTTLPARIPQIAFGANRNLANLMWKFRHYGEQEGATPEPFFVLPATVPRAEVVMCNVGYSGYLYAALLTDRSGDPVASRLVADREAPVAVLLLTADQMRMIHRSEGVPESSVTGRSLVSCDVALLETRCLGASLTCQVYALPAPYLSFDGATPVRFPTAPTDGTAHRVRAQRVAWQRILAHPQIARRLGGTVRTGDDLVTALRSDGGLAAPDLLSHVKRVIADELCLRSASGRPLDPRAGLDLLVPERAWRAAPTLADSLAG